MNKTLKILLFSDVFLLTGFGLIAPVLAIFIKDELIGGSIVAAGIASALYFTVKAIIQVPLARYVDSHEDKRKWLIVGTILVTSVPFIYILADRISTIMIAQLINGIGAGIAAPAWLSLWSKHLDKNHEGFEWSVYSATIGVCTGLAAFAGAALAEFIGFDITFAIAGVASFIACLFLFHLHIKTFPKEKVTAEVGVSLNNMTDMNDAKTGIARNIQEKTLAKMANKKREEIRTINRQYHKRRKLTPRQHQD